MRDEVLEFLRQNQGDFVWVTICLKHVIYTNCHFGRHIKALRQKGHKLESYTKRGYRLLEEPD